MRVQVPPCPPIMSMKRVEWMKGFFIVFGYNKDGWEVLGTGKMIFLWNLMITFVFNKYVYFVPSEYDSNVKYFVIHLSKDFDFWYRKRKHEGGISLGFLSFYWAKNKDFYHYDVELDK